ncbi:Cupin domain protein [Duganella sp. CF458]|uniref:cupin domain-containing protein n=1 Tax=Duganella sp. CF458 TaxID=1884368 RepID=UPI0008EDD558|nr:cupin domain-containing protein [Duganella sp. CF458]SFF56607.1 Cupin domain protein [Duganella sp. CF458]
MLEKKNLASILAQLTHLPNRTPEMAFDGVADRAFAEVAPFRDGSISVGYYSGSSEWERHPAGDEIVMALEGSTTVIVLVEGQQQRIQLHAGELLVVPQNHWHRFEHSDHLKILGVTPQPSDHSLELPDT